MASRTVRLDEEAERALEELRRTTGMTISQTLKEGLLALRLRLRQDPTRTPWDLYEHLDLGPGGYLDAPSSSAKRTVRDVIRKKHRR